ncbi:MAG TPA: metallopeptidase TldD-related protein [Candidatus Acidoferrales bacterium]
MTAWKMQSLPWIAGGMLLLACCVFAVPLRAQETKPAAVAPDNPALNAAASASAVATSVITTPPEVWAAAGKAASTDPVLQAMYEELDRSKSRLKMENVPAPYYIEYRLTDFDEYVAEAAFGALEIHQRARARSIRVVVRVGDYKFDSYYGPGMGVVDLGPLDDNSIALRRQLWMATDRAYKSANEALAAKKALLSQFTSGQPFNDFAPATPLQQIDPLVKLDVNPEPWDAMLEKSSSVFRSDPQIESLTSTLRFRAVNTYFVNSEGTVTRNGYAIYSLILSGATQAADGMRLERSPYFTAGTLAELPSAEEFQADAVAMVDTLKKLRAAPMVEEEYSGPVLFSADAACDVFSGMIGGNVLGTRPKPGDSARTNGEFASSYKSRVLPVFLSMVDDPTLRTFQGKTLVGSYGVDEEGVRASKVAVIQDGILENYLMGREPIRDFPASNGHGRAAPGRQPFPSIGNLIVESKVTSTPEELKKKLIDMCRGEGKPFCYRVETLADFNPRLLYRVYVSDGHEELVRGADFNDLDTRSLRNDLIAVGNDPLVSNRQGFVPVTVIAPSILFDEIEVKRTPTKNAKLPEYPPPDLTK